MAPVSKRTDLTKQERVYRAVRERILSGTYGPGFRVVIDALAEEFGVSALPVREAIWRLEAEGLTDRLRRFPRPPQRAAQQPRDAVLAQAGPGRVRLLDSLIRELVAFREGHRLSTARSVVDRLAVAE